MATTNAVTDNTERFNQHDETIKLATKLVADLEAAEHFGETKDAVVRFIAALDEEVYVLGDADLCVLAGDALERRGKPRKWAALFATNYVNG